MLSKKTCTVTKATEILNDTFNIWLLFKNEYQKCLHLLSIVETLNFSSMKCLIDIDSLTSRERNQGQDKETFNTAIDIEQAVAQKYFLPIR